MGHDAPRPADQNGPSDGDLPNQALSGRHSAVLVTTVAAFALFIFGVIQFGWGFEQMAGVFSDSASWRA